MMEDGVRLLVQHGRETVEVQADPADKISDVMKKVESLSGVLARQQKLIYKGKTLPSTATIQECSLQNGAKIMMMSSAGGGSTQAGSHGTRPHHILFHRRCQHHLMSWKALTESPRLMLAGHAGSQGGGRAQSSDGQGARTAGTCSQDKEGGGCQGVSGIQQELAGVHMFCACVSCTCEVPLNQA
jgi:hypothetical protein